MVSRARSMTEVRMQKAATKATQREAAAAAAKAGKAGGRRRHAPEEEESGGPSAEDVYGLAGTNDGGMWGRRQHAMTSKLSSVARVIKLRKKTESDHWGAKWDKEMREMETGGSGNPVDGVSLRLDVQANFPTTEATRLKEQDTRRTIEVLHRHLSTDGSTLTLGGACQEASKIRRDPHPHFLSVTPPSDVASIIRGDIVLGSPVI